MSPDQIGLRESWEDLRSISLIVPLVGLAVGATWLATTALDLSSQVSAALTGTTALTSALLLESRRRARLSMPSRPSARRSLGPIQAVPEDFAIDEFVLNEAWTAQIARRVMLGLESSAISTIVWLSAPGDKAAFHLYPLHRTIEDSLGKKMQALFVDAVTLERDDLTLVTRLSSTDEIVLVEIMSSGPEIVSRANECIKGRTSATIAGSIMLFERAAYARSAAG